MALETGTYVQDLVQANPDGADFKQFGDNHLRLIKSVLKNTFPNADRALYFHDVETITTTEVVNAADQNRLFLADASGGAFSITLPAIGDVPTGFKVTVAISDVTGNIVTISAADSIEGRASVTLERYGEYLVLYSTGSTWEIASNNISNYFTPTPTSPATMKVRLQSGVSYSDGAYATVAAQETAAITAPSVDPRNDIVYIDPLTGVVGVTTGAEAVTPVDPSVDRDKIPIARIRLQTSTTQIDETILDDIRGHFLGLIGVGPAGLDDGTRIQERYFSFDPTPAGAADAYEATYSPAPAVLVDGQTFTFEVIADNTGASTFTPNAGTITAKSIRRRGEVLVGGELIDGKRVTVRYDVNNDWWELLDGYVPVNWEQQLTGTGTITAPGWATHGKVRGRGAGGGGGRGDSAGPGGGGGGGGYNDDVVPASLLDGEDYSVGVGGPGSASANTDGTDGTPTTIGTDPNWRFYAGAGAGGAGGGVSTPGSGGGGGGAESDGQPGSDGFGAAGGLPGYPYNIGQITPTKRSGEGGASSTAAFTDAEPGVYGAGKHGGGGGGGQGAGEAVNGNPGGDAEKGGGGGGGGVGNATGAGSLGGTSTEAGDGGVGGYDSVPGGDGVAPAGGGGGSELAISGDGADGDLYIVWIGV